MTQTTMAHNLLASWQALQKRQPRLRARNAAAQLGVSEGELTAARIGADVQRLRADFPTLLARLIKVGEVLTITRNDNAVHEKRGYYSNLQLSDWGGGVFDANINLRIFFNNWGEVFAVNDHGRQSLQVFDVDGTACHKIYATDNSDMTAWDLLVADFSASDQTPAMQPRPVHSPYEPQPRSQADAAALCRQWRELTDIHHFWFMLREHRLTRLDALKLATPDLARPVAQDAWRDVLEKVASSGLAIMAFTRSPGVAQIHSGPIQRLLEKDGWFNILDPTFNLHLYVAAVHEVWVVFHPNDSGGQTSLELYDAAGKLVCHFFGAVNLEAPELRGWRRLLADLPTLEAPYQAVG